MAVRHNRDSRPDSQVTRRTLLAAGTAAVAASAVPAAALRHAGDVVAENPTLLAMGAELAKVEKDYHDAFAAEREIWRIWSPQWPLAPDPCCDFNWWGGDPLERNLAGGAIVRPGRERPAKVETIESAEKRIDWLDQVMERDAKKKHKASRKTRDWWQSERDRCELAIQLLPGYEAECERIKRESGFEEAARQKNGRAIAPCAFVRKVLMEPSSTIEGVRIKAQACAAISRMALPDRDFARVDDFKLKSGMAEMLGLAVLEVI